MTTSRERLVAALLPPLGWGSGAVGALFLAASLTPGLLPRPWTTQGAVSGTAFALGYLLASLARRPAAVLLSRTPPRARTAAGVVAVAASSGLAAAALWLHHAWQLDVRRLMNADTGIGLYPVGIALTALAVGYLLIQLGRAVRGVHRWQVERLSRVVPRRWVLGTHLAADVVLVVLLLDVVVAGRLLGAIEGAAAAADARIEDARPASTYRAGGPGSLLAWEDLGRQGRVFVASGPAAADVAQVTGASALEPIRVYAGLRTGDTAGERARVAVAELERVGGFSRDVVVVVVPTGTGWVDPYAVTPLEYLHGGSTAAVAVQYSYRPSWIQLLGNQDVAKEAAVALIDAVSARIQREPEASRPQLLVYGQSLGAFGAEAAFADLDDVVRRVDGALWVGPPRWNRLWQRLSSDRHPESPVWQPVHDAGRRVRFGADGRALAHPASPWHRPRVVYLQHASDPVTWWTPDLILNRPEWLDGERGPDVSDRTPYLPVLTFVQLTIDLMSSTSAPPEHGHVFGPAQAEAWALISAPGRPADHAAKRGEK